MRAPAPQIRTFQAADGYPIAVRTWDTARSLARIVFVHGIISHGGWYLNGCRHLARAGFEVHFLDRRGSGLNPANRGDVDRCQTWLSDVAGYLKSLPGGLRTVLLGISWGGKFSAAFAREFPELIDGFGMLCPGLFARQMPGPFKTAALSIAGAVGLNSLRVTIPLQDPALFTESAKWQDYIRHDPFTLRQVTVRFALANRHLTRIATISPGEIRKPALLALAGRDLIVDNRRVREYFERLGSADKTLLEYANAAHTLEFEPDPTPFFDDLTSWALRVVNMRAPTITST